MKLQCFHTEVVIRWGREQKCKLPNTPYHILAASFNRYIAHFLFCSPVIWKVLSTWQENNCNSFSVVLKRAWFVCHIPWLFFENTCWEKWPFIEKFSHCPICLSLLFSSINCVLKIFLSPKIQLNIWYWLLWWFLYCTCVIYIVDTIKKGCSNEAKRWYICKAKGVTLHTISVIFSRLGSLSFCPIWMGTGYLILGWEKSETWETPLL